MAAPPGREFSHAGAHPAHGTLRWPPMQVVDAAARPFPYLSTHAFAQMAPEESRSPRDRARGRRFSGVRGEDGRE